ncbi:MAG: adenylate/guanylate cyclase domain-containing protein [Candidatus Kryptoniota bacterium]
MIPTEERFPFMQEAYFTNYYRARIFAMAIFAIHIFLIYVDLRHKANGMWASLPGYRYLFYLHVVLEIVLLIFILLMTMKKPAAVKDIRLSHMVTVIVFILFIFGWSASLSSVDQMIHGIITVYIIALFGIAVAFYTTGGTSLSMYMLAHIYFMVGITHTQTNHDILLGHYINGSALAVVAWVLSRLVFSARVREFLNVKTIERQKGEIEESKEEIESILKNVLPESIVKKMNGSSYPPPENNPSITISFADFVSFYKIAEKSDAKDVLNILEKMFNAFDESVRKHGLEKLKTMGDCYMFAGGLFKEDNQLVDTVEAAIEIRDIVGKFAVDIKARTGHDWALRIGIHTGPAISGIIGSWRFIYDVWGPTVNIASRLEAASLPNKVNVSHQVYDKLIKKGNYSLEPRGALAIKNMEAVEMYFVERKRETRS